MHYLSELHTTESARAGYTLPCHDDVQVEFTDQQLHDMQGMLDVFKNWDSIDYIVVRSEPSTTLIDDGKPVVEELDLRRVLYSCQVRIYSTGDVQIVWLPKDGEGESWLENEINLNKLPEA